MATRSAIMQIDHPAGPPITLSTPALYDQAIPAEVDAVIVGGGIIGMCAAWTLQKMGKTVVVCEKGRIGGEQSSRNWGWVRQTGRDPAELPIMMESIALWQSLAAETGDNNLLFTQQGVLYLATDNKKIERFEAFSTLAKEHGLDSQVLSAAEAKAKIPSINRNITGGLLTPSDGRVEPWGAVPALARACAAAGVVISENCAVRTIDQQKNAVTQVITEKGPIKTNKVLVAGGAWSSLLTRQAGIVFPQLSVTSYAVRIEGTPDLFDGNVADDGLGICKRLDGGYNVALTDYHQFAIGPDAFRHLRHFKQAVQHSWHETHFKMAAPKGYPDSWRTARRWKPDQTTPFEHNRVLNPIPISAVRKRIKERLQARFGAMPNANISHAWAGLIDTTPDFVPILDETPLQGLFLATGFSGHGFGIGPAAGKIMANKMMGQAVEHDLSRFRFLRFADGSPYQLGPM